MKEFFYNFLEPLSPFMPLLLLTINIKRVRAFKDLLLLFFVYSGVFILNLAASVYAYFDTKNIWLYNLLCITSFILISLYFLSILKTPVKKKTIYFFLPGYIVFFLCYTYVFDHSALFNSISFAILSLLVSTYSILYFVEKLTLMEDRRLQDAYSFWIITSFFVYYLGSFFIFLTYDHMTSAGITVGKLWGVHNIIYFISGAIAAFGLWKQFQVKYT